ncbi:MAG TPA: BBP7 family outer membrane beta-barrel protein [Gemmataceae bacterium]|nr:BBP7 family outer membrane beta-barrel protein [Gemmataceae bacterium]
MDLRMGLGVMVVAIANWPVLAGPPDGSSPRIVIVNDDTPTARKIINLKPDNDTPKQRVVDLDSDTLAPPVERLPDVDTPRMEGVAGASVYQPICPQPRVWIEGDFISWKVQKGPLGFPLVTTADPNDGPRAGAIGLPSTRILFGGGDLDYSRSPGFRLTVGGWLNNDPVGVEATVFWLNSSDIMFGAASNGLGLPAIYLPSFNVVTGNEGRLTVADSLAGFAGGVGIRSQSRLWGWDANAVFALSRGSTEVTLLAGFRYADMSESLQIQSSSRDLVLLTQNEALDQFDTANQFYGGQVGARINQELGRWSLGATAKLAVGETFQTINVSGVTRQSAPANTFAGGFYALPSNIGRRTVDHLSAIPELNLRAGYQVTNCLRAFVGYDVLCWTQVARPGDQIDRATNPTQSPVFGAGSLTGAARPAWLTNSGGFYAQGFSVGVEFRY